MGELKELLSAEYLGNSLWQWSVGLTVVLGVMFTLLIVRRMVRSQYERLAATPEREVLETPLQIISRTTVAFILIVAIFSGLQVVELPPKLAAVVRSAFTISVFWQVGLWASTAVMVAIERKRAAAMQTDRAAAGTLGIIAWAARTILWVFVVLLTLDNLGIEIKPLLAGMGIGGIAIALAVKNVLEDLFASLSITFDKPFVVGDFLVVDDFKGTVEFIGIKSTRLRSLNGEQIIMPNSSLLSSRIRNNARMRERRMVFTLNISQETPRDKLAKLPGILKGIVEKYKDVRFDHSHFMAIGPNSFDFETVYIVLTAAGQRHMDIQQEINLSVLETFEAEGIEMAVSTQKLLMERPAGVQSELIEGEDPFAAAEINDKPASS